MYHIIVRFVLSLPTITGTALMWLDDSCVLWDEDRTSNTCVAWTLIKTILHWLVFNLQINMVKNWDRNFLTERGGLLLHSILCAFWQSRPLFEIYYTVSWSISVLVTVLLCYIPIWGYMCSRDYQAKTKQSILINYAFLLTQFKRICIYNSL